MRAELPWNVAGIPPEAREAARAQARREGLSVGEWLTRRIIAELGEGAAAIPASTGAQGPNFVSAANRHETEAMLARLAQAEADASHTYRRIEEQLHSMGSGLDNAERSQSEMSRAMSRAATEITLASSEQAHAFDQLGRHMSGLDQRVENLERAAIQDGLREAVKGLHQGLSRLADQFGQATARSGGQVASLARNLEQLALRLVQLRADAETAAAAMEGHLGQLEETQTFTNGTIEQILGRMDAQDETHHQTLAEMGRRQLAHQDVLADLQGRLEGRLAALEEPDLALAQRLEAIEQVLVTVSEELNQPDPHAGLAEALRQVSLRLDLAEQNQNDMLAELREGLARIPEPGVPDPVIEEQPSVPAEKSFVPVPADMPMAAYEELAAQPEPMVEELPAAPVAPSGMMPDNFVEHAFASHFEMPQDFADALTRPSPANDGSANDGRSNAAPANDMPADATPVSERDFLENARRSAREAAEEDQRGGLLGWTRPDLGEVEKKRPIHLMVLAGLFFALLAVAAILMMRQRAVTPAPLPKHVATVARPIFVPHLQMAQPQPAQTGPAAVAKSAAPSDDKVLAAANGGNDTAETIIGLRTLDAGDSVAAFQWLERAALQGQPVAEYRLGTLYERGQGVTASAVLAVKWYLAAANQGNRKAMHNLAVAYAEGSAGAKDTAEAARWFAQAAALGLSDSQFNLAVLYERGDGVPQSLTDSYKWYSIAAAGGDAESKARLSVLKTQLSPADRLAAERAAQSFQPEPLDRAANLPPEPGDLGS